MEREQIATLLREHQEALKIGDTSRADAIISEISNDYQASVLLGDKLYTLREVTKRMKTLAPYKAAMKEFAAKLTEKIRSLEGSVDAKSSELAEVLRELEDLRKLEEDTEHKLSENNKHIHDLQIVVEKRDERIHKLVEQVQIYSKFRDAYRAQRPIVSSLFDEVRHLKEGEVAEGANGKHQQHEKKLQKKLKRQYTKNAKLEAQIKDEKERFEAEREKIIGELEEMRSGASSAKYQSEDLSEIIAKLQAGLCERISYVEENLIKIMDGGGKQKSKALGEVKKETAAIREEIDGLAAKAKKNADKKAAEKPAKKSPVKKKAVKQPPAKKKTPAKKKAVKQPPAKKKTPAKKKAVKKKSPAKRAAKKVSRSGKKKGK